MSHMIVRHKVENYANWKKTFDAFAEVRKAGGEKSFQILHLDDDPNNIMVVFEWDDLQGAKDFMGTPELEAAMIAAGVVEPPDTYFLHEVERGTI